MHLLPCNHVTSIPPPLPFPLLYTLSLPPPRPRPSVLKFVFNISGQIAVIDKN